MGKKGKLLILIGIISIFLIGIMFQAYARDDASLFRSSDPRNIYSSGVTGDDSKTAVSSNCTVYDIEYTSTMAGDGVTIYDATSVTGTPKFCLCVSTAYEYVHTNIPTDGVSFDNGITFQESNGANRGFITIIYE